jgi:hypothetical protein
MIVQSTGAETRSSGSFVGLGAYVGFHQRSEKLDIVFVGFIHIELIGTECVCCVNTPPIYLSSPL